MLKSLNIKNYAIIDDLTIDFDRGFNVFTGETGAGKSIIVGALSFLLKGRSDTSVIKTDKDKAIIEGIFQIDDLDIINKLKAQDIDVVDEVIIKRVISRDNHSTIKINESSVTLNFLEDLFSDYVDIHSQKDNHFLFNKKNQLALLDKYHNNTTLINDYISAYEKYIKLNDELNTYVNSTFSEREMDFYKFDYSELVDANLSIDEEKQLQEAEERYKAKEKYITTLSNALGYYDQNYGIKELIQNMFNALNIDDDNIQDITSKIKDLYYELDENADKLKSILDSLNDADTSIEQIEERLYLYSKLKRKHKTDTEGLLKIKDELENKLSLFDNRERIISKKENEVNEAKQIALQLGKKLSEIRKTSAINLASQVIDEANDLLLNNIKFEIAFKEIDLSLSGIDDVEFMVSLNKGEDVKPLRNVASGGEISRLMLALKVVFTRLSNTGLLILDEIDAGVSGKVAQAIGLKIAKIANFIQVICISHLSPVAACADSHFLIYKQDDESHTYTNVRRLIYDDIIEQLAIISNTSNDQKALEAAKELFLTSQKAVHES